MMKGIEEIIRLLSKIGHKRFISGSLVLVHTVKQGRVPGLFQILHCLLVNDLQADPCFK
jgi:hypothetical protein